MQRAKPVNKKSYGLNKASKIDNESNKSLFGITELNNQLIIAKTLFINAKSDYAVYDDGFNAEFKLFDLIQRKQLETDDSVIIAILKSNDTQKIENAIYGV